MSELSARQIVVWARAKAKMYQDLAAMLEEDIANDEPYVIASDIAIAMAGRSLRLCEIASIGGWDVQEVEKVMRSDSRFKVGRRGWWSFDRVQKMEDDLRELVDGTNVFPINEYIA